MEYEGGDITAILRGWDSDREAAIERLTPIVYGELHKIAKAYLARQRHNHTLQPTALIHEAYLRLVKQDAATIQDRSHFYSLAARMMRQILVDAARVTQAQKRGSGTPVQFDERIELGAEDRTDDFFAIHEALAKLELRDHRAAQTVELRYFGGMQLDEIAEAMGSSLATVKRDLALGQAWLRRALK